MMLTMTNFNLYALGFIAGLGIPVMAAMSGQLSSQLGLAKGLFVLFSIAFTISFAYLMLSGGSKLGGSAVVSIKSISPVFYISGAIVVFYMLAVSIVGPKIGIANTIVLVLLGQIISALLIDHFGLFNYPMIPIDGKKIMGAILMVLGIYLTRR